MKQIIAFIMFFQGDGRRAALMAGLVSAALLATVYFFQYVLKILPCELCYWQRKPHMALVVLGVIGFFIQAPRHRASLLWFMALLALSNVGLSIFHVGVEYHWWKGLDTCSTPSVVTATVEEARDLLFGGTTVIPCDKPGWVFLGISMAAWNGVMCLGLSLWLALGALRSKHT